MVLVVGSTGRLGSQICYHLAVKGFPIRALVRCTSDPARIERLQKYGAVLARGDLRDPASLAAACEGAHAVICSATAMNSAQSGINDLETVDLQGVSSLIQAAKRAEVTHFVYISILMNPRLVFPLQSIKQTIEQRIVASGLTYTILRPGFFMETWLPQKPGDGGREIQVYGKGDRPVRWISSKDVALLAMLSLQTQAAWNAILDVTGPEALSQNQVIARYEKASGKNIVKGHISKEALRRLFQSAKDPVQQSVLGSEIEIAEGNPEDQGAEVFLLSKGLTTVENFYAEVQKSM